MRDPRRIERIVSKLELYWKEVPDWRFGQLIENLKRYSGHPDLFYIEDYMFEQILDGFFNGEE